MNSKKDFQKNKEWLKDYEEFISLDSSTVPTEVTKNLFSKINNLLNPSAWMIFTKIFGIHIVIGTLSLAVCHQFGLDPFHTKFSLADWFMQVGGHGFCMVACGILFLGLSLMTAGYFLSIEEIRVLRSTKLLQISALSLFSLGLLAAVGAQLALAIVGLWLIGTFTAGFVVTEAVWQLRQNH